MGYRNYIGSLPKKEWESIKGFSKKEVFYHKGLDKEEDCLSVYDIAYNEVYGFGKYVDIKYKDVKTPVFTNKQTQSYFDSESDFEIVEKDFLEKVIEMYSLKIREYYKEMLSPFELLRDGKSEFLESVKHTWDDDFNTQYSFDFTKINQEEVNAFQKMIQHVKSMSSEWGLNFLNNRPYSLEEGKQVTTSWKYEYAQFELVRIYKNFDWENNVMIYYGY